MTPVIKSGIGFASFFQNVFQRSGHIRQCRPESVLFENHETGEAKTQHDRKKANRLDIAVFAEAKRILDQFRRQPGQKNTGRKCCDPPPQGRFVPQYDTGHGKKRPVPEIKRITDQAEPDQNPAGKNPFVEPAILAGSDQQNGRQDRKQGPCSGVAFSIGVSDKKHGNRQQQSPGHGEDMAESFMFA